MGRREYNPVQFYVHKDKLVSIPYFAAALQENAFLEGQQHKISFEEEDVAVFRHCVEFIYEGDCFPRWKKPLQEPLSLEPSTQVERVIAKSVPEEYSQKLSFGVSSGTYIATAKTHELLYSVVQLLCLADRYGIEDLAQLCLQKMKHFPIGTKEVALLIQHIVGNIPETRTDVYEFLMDQIRLHRPRLNDCPAFRSLLENETSILGQGIARLLINVPTPAQVLRMFNAVEKGAKAALCIEEVTIKGCIAAFGADDEYPIKFGAAKTGEFLITNAAIDKRGIFCAQREIGGPSLAFPRRSFIFMAIATSP